MFVGQYYEEFASAIVKFYGSCSDHSIEGEGIVSKWTRQRWGKVNTTKVIEWKVYYLFLLFVCLCLPLILSFNFLLMRCFGGRIDRAYQGKEDNRSIGAEIVERTC